jgi:crotonobetainyl-CoA:carnitine CoA-transferase CaiB-like acyl-CoA transferase
VIDRLGFGYLDMAEREPRILYVSVSGFGQTGPLAERPAMDPVLQAYTGLMAENAGEDGIPHRTPIIAIDMSTGMFTFGAVAAALHARQHLPRGRHIEASLMQAAAGLQVIRMMGSYMDGGAPRPVIPPSGVYKTADGWISITVVRRFEWEGYCKALDLPDILAQERFGTTEGRQAHAAELNAVLQPLLAAGTTAAWSERLAGQRVMHEALNSYSQFLQQAHVTESGAMAWISHPHVPQPLPMPNLIGLPPFEDGSPRTLAPGKGEHGEAILREHGFSAQAINDLAAQGVVVL